MRFQVYMNVGLTLFNLLHCIWILLHSLTKLRLISFLWEWMSSYHWKSGVHEVYCEFFLAIVCLFVLCCFVLLQGHRALSLQHLCTNLQHQVPLPKKKNSNFHSFFSHLKWKLFEEREHDLALLKFQVLAVIPTQKGKMLTLFIYSLI